MNTDQLTEWAQGVDWGLVAVGVVFSLIVSWPVLKVGWKGLKLSGRVARWVLAVPGRMWRAMDAGPNTRPMILENPRQNGKGLNAKINMDTARLQAGLAEAGVKTKDVANAFRKLGDAAGAMQADIAKTMQAAIDKNLLSLSVGGQGEAQRPQGLISQMLLNDMSILVPDRPFVDLRTENVRGVAESLMIPDVVMYNQQRSGFDDLKLKPVPEPREPKFVGGPADGKNAAGCEGLVVTVPHMEHRRAVFDPEGRGTPPMEFVEHTYRREADGDYHLHVPRVRLCHVCASEIAGDVTARTNGRGSHFCSPCWDKGWRFLKNGEPTSMWVSATPVEIDCDVCAAELDAPEDAAARHCGVHQTTYLCEECAEAGWVFRNGVAEKVMRVGDRLDQGYVLG